MITYLSNPVMGFIEELTCKQVANYMHYVFFRGTIKIYHGGKEYRIVDVCMMYDDLPGKAVLIRAQCGPPNARAYRNLTIADYVKDCYWLAKAQRSDRILGKFRDAVGVAV